MNLKELKLLKELIDNQIIELSNNEYDWDNAPVICTVDGLKFLLGPECEEQLSWDDAIEWCKQVGGELPTRDVLLLSYMNDNIKKEFKEFYYWSMTEFNATFAWRQSFSGGDQFCSDKTNYDFVRAVRKVLI